MKNRSFWERFGKIDKSFKPGGIHIHCVSVGEVNAAAGLIKTLLKEYSNLPITITTSSTTGAVHAYQMFKDEVQHCYLPVDIPILMHRFYRKLQPKLVLVTEVEIWPNMVSASVKRGVPIILINARMTTKSLENYRKFTLLFRHAYREFTKICAQSSESFQNFLSYGVYKTRLSLSNNMKFDLVADEKDAQLGQKILTNYGLNEKRILVAASTHDPEEKMILKTYSSLKQEHANLVLVIVPRHPHRFDDVYQLIKATGLNTVRMSESDSISNTNSQDNEIDCLLVDAMGCLKACYSICDTAFVGGSFAPKGGHNALEAALYSKPITMGPSIFNNPSICSHLVEKNALVITHSEQELTQTINKWLSNPDQALKDGEGGMKVLIDNAGSIENTMGILRNYL